jgi:hypothetical protein
MLEDRFPALASLLSQQDLSVRLPKSSIIKLIDFVRLIVAAVVQILSINAEQN